MSPLLIALLGMMLIPLFVSTWRTSLLGLSCQGFLMGWIAYRMGARPPTANEWLTLGDLFLIRGIGAPLALYRVLSAQNLPARNDIIPPNLLSWTLALSIVLISFNFSESLIPEHGQQQTLVAVAGAGIMLGFLVLATQSDPFSQMIGAIRIENSIALLELGGERHHHPLVLQLGQIAVVALTIGFYRWYLITLRSHAVAPEAVVEGPTL